MQFKNLASIDRSAIEVEWIVTSADDWNETFTVYHRGTTDVVDISGWTFSGAIAETRNSDLVLATIAFSFPNGGTDGQAAYGVEYPTSILPRGKYWYELDVATPTRRAFQAGVLDVRYDHVVMA